MAVEAQYLNCLSPQLMAHREVMHPLEGNLNLCNSFLEYGVPLSGTTAAESLLRAYNSVIVDSFAARTVAGAMKSESGVTHSLPRKRSRDAGKTSFLREDITLHIQKQQMEIDNLISQHMEKVRLEVEEKRKIQARRLREVLELGMVKRMREKEEEIEKMGKLNWALQERVKSLWLENQIWRDLAQTNEATVNALRTNLQQVMAQIKEDRRTTNEPTPALIDDAQSCCCGSNGGGEEEEEEDGGAYSGWRTIAGRAGEEKGGGRLCRNCGKEESCVVMLPCRHLCLCGVCGSSLRRCPICKATKTRTVHVSTN